MHRKPDLSVIVPHLNAADALDRCIGALAMQRDDKSDFEVVVVDNGSDILPSAVCSAYDFVRLTREMSPGPGPARNHGAHLAQSDLLAFLDCDCIVQDHWISNVIEYFQSHTGAAVVGGEVVIHRAGAAALTMIEAYESVYGYRMQLYIERDNYAATCNMAVRRDVFDAVGGFAGISIAEDVDWGRRATALDLRIDYVPEIRIATPARTTFLELARKWDRHIGHDYAELNGRIANVRWILRALALAASPLIETVRVARSPKISGLKERGLAFLCLVCIRLYRCQRMIGLVFRGDAHVLSGAWRHRR